VCTYLVLYVCVCVYLVACVSSVCLCVCVSSVCVRVCLWVSSFVCVCVCVSSSVDVYLVVFMCI